MVEIGRRNLMPWFLFIVLACLSLVPVQAAQSKDHIVQRGWLEDPSGQMTWEQARQQSTLPFEGTLNLGYGHGVVWLRLRIDPDGGPGQTHTSPELILRVRPVYLDEITVYDPLSPGGLAGVLGDRLHPQLAMTPGFDFLLTVPRGEAPRDIWLRIATLSTRQIHVMAVHPGDLEVLAMRLNMMASLYVGLILLMMTWGTVNLVLRRDPVMGAFAVMQLTAALFALSSSGMLRIVWPTEFSAAALDMLGSLFSVGVVAGGLLFHLRFLRDVQPGLGPEAAAGPAGDVHPQPGTAGLGRGDVGPAKQYADPAGRLPCLPGLRGQWPRLAGPLG